MAHSEPAGERHLGEIRRRLGEALADPRRRQLAHVAVLDIAMTATERLADSGLSSADVARAAEEISAFLHAETDELAPDLASRGAVLEALRESLQAAGRNPSFASIFGPPPRA